MGLDTERARAYLATLPEATRPREKRESPQFTGKGHCGRSRLRRHCEVATLWPCRPPSCPDPAFCAANTIGNCAIVDGVDDQAPTIGDQHRRDMIAGNVMRTTLITGRFDRLLPEASGHWSGTEISGVVDENIEATKLLSDPCEKRGDGGGLGGVPTALRLDKALARFATESRWSRRTNRRGCP